MAQIQWMQVCELAYFDRNDRLGMVGITTHLIVPALPVRMRQMMLVGRLTGVSNGERLSISVAMATPSGEWIAPSSDDDVHVEVASEYVIVTLREAPFREEGAYRFAIQLGEDQLATVDIPVVVMLPAVQRHAEVH